ncbi:hypothetical protein N665_0451s0036 [Sinapis alba]|nr:hypothetical protein N665_0451s0036 [Sinapis alba]
MGNCATKPKVLKDSEEDMVPVERDMAAAPTEHNKATAEKSRQSNAPDAAASRRSEKGKEIIMVEDVVKEEEHNNKRPSLSPLFHEDKVIGKELTDVTKKIETNDKSGASSEVSKLDDASPLMATNVKAPESFDVQTRDDLEVKIPKDSEVKTPETPKAKEAEKQEVHFSENWEVKFPEELESNKTSEAVKVKEESKPQQVSKVSAPELSDVNVTKESGVPKVLEDKNVQEVPEVRVTKESDVPKVFKDKKVPEDSEVHAPPELSDIKVKKESDVPEVLEDKNVLKTDEVKAAESELLKVSEVKSSGDLEIKVPEVFEVKTPKTLNGKVESEVKTDQEASQVNIVKETEFLDAQEKIDKAEAQILEDIKVTEDKEVMMSKKEEEKGLSIEKNVKESTLSDLESK